MGYVRHNGVGGSFGAPNLAGRYQEWDRTDMALMVEIIGGTDVPCPSCKAEAGQWCSYRGKANKELHRPRLNAALNAGNWIIVNAVGTTESYLLTKAQITKEIAAAAGPVSSRTRAILSSTALLAVAN